MTPQGNARRWPGPPLALQIMALLLAGLVVAQGVTLALTMLLPPEPQRQWQLGDIARVLSGQAAEGRNAGLLQRSLQARAPEPKGQGWLTSERSRRDLAQLLARDESEVRLYFFTPLPFAGTAGAVASTDGDTRAMVRHASGAFHEGGFIRVQAGGMPTMPSSPGGFGGPGAPGGLAAPGGGFPGGIGNLNGGFGAGRGSGGSIAGSPQQQSPQQSQPQQAQPQQPGGTGAPAAGNATASPSAPATQPSVAAGATQSPGLAAQTPAASTGAPATPIAPNAPSALTAPGAPGTPGTIGAPAATAPGTAAQPAGPSPMGQPPAMQGQPAIPSPFASSPPVRLPEPAPVPPLVTEKPASRKAPAATEAPATHTPEPPSKRAEAAPRAAPETPAPAPPRTAEAPRQPRASAPDDTDTDTLAERPAARGLFGLAPAPFVEGDFIAAVYTREGSWVVVQPIPESFPNAWQRRVLLWFLLAAAIVIPAGWLFSRRLVRPIAGFARAADQLGRDPAAPVLALEGPAEIGRAAQAFNRMQARLRSFVDDRTVMIGAISHDLRTPLTRLRFRIEDVPDDVRAGMLGDVEEMEHMIGSVLDFIRDASVVSARERMDLASLVEDVVEQAVFVGKDVQLQRTEHAQVELDAIGMRRVLDNLVENAVKYGNQTRVRLFTDGHDAVVEISDRGPGLPADELERVFKPFYRTAQARTSRAAGSGLGLAVCRSIARAHGGDVVLKSGPHGLLAQVRVPLALDAQDRRPAPPASMSMSMPASMSPAAHT
jgi:two-component system OmpR family sensor kinase